MGVEAATEIYTQGLCLEESLAALPVAGGRFAAGARGGGALVGLPLAWRRAAGALKDRAAEIPPPHGVGLSSGR